MDSDVICRDGEVMAFLTLLSAMPRNLTEGDRRASTASVPLRCNILTDGDLDTSTVESVLAPPLILHEGEAAGLYPFMSLGSLVNLMIDGESNAFVTLTFPVGLASTVAIRNEEKYLC